MANHTRVKARVKARVKDPLKVYKKEKLQLLKDFCIEVVGKLNFCITRRSNF